MTDKRNIDDHSFFATNVVVELEGVVLRNNFEEEEVFPFVRQKIEEHLDKNWTEKSFQEIVQILREQAKLHEEQKVEGFVAIPEGEEEDAKKAVLKNLLWQLDGKQITEGFKKIQKQICESGNLKIKLCENVDTCFKTWKDEGRNIFILSSYNLDEQKLLLANTDKGDLLPIFSDYYNADVGQKNKKETYSKILGKLDCSASDVMFISNKIENAESASFAGLVAVLISKEGSSKQDTAITYVNSLSDIEFETTSKKRKILKESVEISGSSDSQEITKPDISNESDVEMKDVSENGIIKEGEESLEKLENGLGDINKIESKELEVKSDITKGIDDSIKSGNNKTSVDTKNKLNEVEPISMETEVKEEETPGNVLKEDENKKIAEETTCNGLKSSLIVSETFESESVCKTEIKPLTEEIKTDKNVEYLDKEETNLDKEVSLKPEIKDLENPISSQTDKEKTSKKDEASEQNQIIDNSNSAADLNSADEISANLKTENLVLEVDVPSKKLEVISLSSETNTDKDKTNTLKSDLDKPTEDTTSKANEEKVVDELCPSEIKEPTVDVNNVISAKESLQECNADKMESDDSKTTDNTDQQKGGQSLPSENKTLGVNIDTVKAKVDKSSELKIVEVPSSSDSSSETMCNEVEDNQSTSTVKTQPEKISADKDTDISESNLDLPKKPIAKSEVEDKIGEESPTEIKSTNKDVDTAKSEEDNLSEKKGVNATQSLESNTVCIDSETKNSEMEKPSEVNGVVKSSEQNGVNMKDETEKSSAEPVVAQNGIVENGKHINGNNEKLNVENLHCSEKKVENGLTKETEIEA